eukprot:scaffold54935_cov32-Tisochrysis_lutea.AAC.4
MVWLDMQSVLLLTSDSGCRFALTPGACVAPSSAGKSGTSIGSAACGGHRTAGSLKLRVVNCLSACSHATPPTASAASFTEVRPTPSLKGSGIRGVTWGAGRLEGPGTMQVCGDGARSNVRRTKGPFRLAVATVPTKRSPLLSRVVHIFVHLLSVLSLATELICLLFARKARMHSDSVKCGTSFRLWLVMEMFNIIDPLSKSGEGRPSGHGIKKQQVNARKYTGWEGRTGLSCEDRGVETRCAVSASNGALRL